MGFGQRNRALLIVALVALFAFSPIVFLRYDFFDSWGLIFRALAREVFDSSMPCIAVHQHSTLIGRPLAAAIHCAMTAFGPGIDRLWITKLLAFGVFFASGAILAAEMRRCGAHAAVAGLFVLSFLLLPGTPLTVAMVLAAPFAYGALAATLAGHLWVRTAPGLGWSRGRRAAGLLAAVILLIAAMATYQIAAVMFFAPLLIALLFAPKPEGLHAFRLALGAAAVFAVASLAYVAAHSWLLHEHRYFFLTQAQVDWVGTTDRSVTLRFGLDHLLGKARYLGSLLPEIFTLWFVSEWSWIFPPAVIAFAAAALIAFAVLLHRRPAGLWHIAAVAIVMGCFFGPFLVSDNSANRLYSLYRVRTFMQVPVVILLWWLVHLLWERRRAWTRAAAAVLVSAVFAGVVVSYVVVLRARVIPNYMELKHIEYRLKEAVRRDIKEIYLIKANSAHVWAVLGSHGMRELGGVTSDTFNAGQMIGAILLQLEKKRIERALITVEAEKGDSVAPAPNRLILDMRSFP